MIISIVSLTFMLQNIFLEIEYDGTNYFGWQVQKRGPQGRRAAKLQIAQEKIKTVQGELEEALKRLFNRDTQACGAGRTDKGVHAKGQCANFKVDTRIPLSNIERALNTFLPPDIYIKRIKSVPLSFHSRFNAISKLYRYVIINKKSFSVFMRNYAWHIPGDIDLEKVKKAALRISGKKDFSCFAKQPSNYKSCIRTIKNILIKKTGSYVYIDIEADGFLSSMARNIVSFLIMIGKRRILLKDVTTIIWGGIKYVNKPAPAQGLYLMKVRYG